MNTRNRQTREERIAEQRKHHLDLLVEVTSLDQLSVGDQLLALYKEQLPDPRYVEHYHWDWKLDSSIRLVESIRDGEARLVGLGERTHNKHYYREDADSENGGIAKLYRANPFHIVLGLTEEYYKRGVPRGSEMILLPGMPSANDCDSILLTIMTRYLDLVLPAFQGFKEFSTSIEFHKAFRSWDVTDIGMIDSIAWDAINGAELFHYFYNRLVLGQFEEWTENNT